MKKTANLNLAGSSLILSGIIMLLFEKIGVANAKLIIPLLFAIAGVFSMVFSGANKHIRIASQFHMIQGIGLLVFAIVIAFLPNSLESFLMYFTYFVLVFGLFEIMFAFFVMNSKETIPKNILIVRMLGGFVTSIGAVILLLTTITDKYDGLTAAGVLTILIGIANIIFASKVKKIIIPE